MAEAFQLPQVIHEVQADQGEPVSDPRELRVALSPAAITMATPAGWRAGTDLRPPGIVITREPSPP